MKIDVRVNQCRFIMDLNQKQVDSYPIRLALSSINVLSNILLLNKAGVTLYEYSPFIKCDHSIVKDEDGKYKLNSTIQSPYCISHKKFTSLLDAVDSIFLSPKFEVNKTYRIIYNAGERAGSKRAIKVNNITDSLIEVEDLSIGEPRKYLLSRISDIEEFTI